MHTTQMCHSLILFRVFNCVVLMMVADGAVFFFLKLCSSPLIMIPMRKANISSWCSPCGLLQIWGTWRAWWVPTFRISLRIHKPLIWLCLLKDTTKDSNLNLICQLVVFVSVIQKEKKDDLCINSFRCELFELHIWSDRILTLITQHPNLIVFSSQWKEAKPEELMDSKLRCVFEMPSDSDKTVSATSDNIWLISLLKAEAAIEISHFSLSPSISLTPHPLTLAWRWQQQGSVLLLAEVGILTAEVGQRLAGWWGSEEDHGRVQAAPAGGAEAPGG